MAHLRGTIDKIGDGRNVLVWLCDAHYNGCVGFGPVFRMPPGVNVYSQDEYIRPQNDIMHKLGWGRYLDGGSDVCPNCRDRFEKEG